MRSPLSLLQAEESLVSQPFLAWELLQSPNHLCGPWLNSLKAAFFELRDPELDAIFHMRMWPHQSKGEGEDHLLQIAAHALYNAPRVTFALPGDKGTLLAHGRSAVHQDDLSFSSKLLSSRSTWNMYWCTLLLLLGCRTLHLLLLKLIRFFSAQHTSDV